MHLAIISDTPSPSIQCVLGSAVYAALEIEKLTLLRWEGNISKMIKNRISLPGVSTLLSLIAVHGFSSNWMGHFVESLEMAC